MGEGPHQRRTFAVPDNGAAFARLRRGQAPRYLILSRNQEVPAWLGAADLKALGGAPRRTVFGQVFDREAYATVLELSVTP